MTATERISRYLIFFLLALTINIVDGALARSLVRPGMHAVILGAAACDLILVISALYYWLLVRPGLRARSSLVLIALLGLLRTTFLLQDGLAIRAFAGAVGECGLLAYVIVQIRRAKHDGSGDPVQRIRIALRSVFPELPARIIAMELGVLYYALFSWRAKPEVPHNAASFTLHLREGQADLMMALAIGSAMEVLPVHLLLAHWSSAAAWIASGFGLYGAIWLVGVARSIALRPVIVGPDFVAIRYGLLFDLRVPASALTAIYSAGAADVVIPRHAQANVVLQLSRELEAEGPFGIRKKVNRIALAADEPERARALIARLVATC